LVIDHFGSLDNSGHSLVWFTLPLVVFPFNGSLTIIGLLDGWFTLYLWSSLEMVRSKRLVVGIIGSLSQYGHRI
jgi:hypothetical protein